jgi:hypothetical protein
VALALLLALTPMPTPTSMTERMAVQETTREKTAAVVPLLHRGPARAGAAASAVTRAAVAVRLATAVDVVAEVSAPSDMCLHHRHATVTAVANSRLGCHRRREVRPAHLLPCDAVVLASLRLTRALSTEVALAGGFAMPLVVAVADTVVIVTMMEIVEEEVLVVVVVVVVIVKAVVAVVVVEVVVVVVVVISPFRHAAAVNDESRTLHVTVVTAAALVVVATCAQATPATTAAVMTTTTTTITIMITASVRAPQLAQTTARVDRREVCLALRIASRGSSTRPAHQKDLFTSRGQRETWVTSQRHVVRGRTGGSAQNTAQSLAITLGTTNKVTKADDRKTTVFVSFRPFYLPHTAPRSAVA